MACKLPVPVDAKGYLSEQQEKQSQWRNQLTLVHLENDIKNKAIGQFFYV